MSTSPNPSRRLKATVLFSILVYGTLVYSVLAESEFWVHAFGPSAWGMATPTVAALVVTLVYIPVPWFAWHGMEILLRGRDIGLLQGRGSVFYTLFTIGRHAPELRRSQIIVIGGFVYFIAIVAAWIYYADSHGL